MTLEDYISLDAAKKDPPTPLFRVGSVVEWADGRSRPAAPLLTVASVNAGEARVSYDILATFPSGPGDGGAIRLLNVREEKLRPLRR